MTLKEFADKYRLKIKKDSCDNLIIPGRPPKKLAVKRLENYHHIDDVGTGKFLVYLTYDSKGKWKTAKHKLEAAGCHITIDLESEGFVAFNESDAKQVSEVIKIARIRSRRIMSDEQKAQIRKRFEKGASQEKKDAA